MGQSINRSSGDGSNVCAAPSSIIEGPGGGGWGRDALAPAARPTPPDHHTLHRRLHASQNHHGHTAAPDSQTRTEVERTSSSSASPSTTPALASKHAVGGAGDAGGLACLLRSPDRSRPFRADRRRALLPVAEAAQSINQVTHKSKIGTCGVGVGRERCVRGCVRLLRRWSAINGQRRTTSEAFGAAWDARLGGPENSARGDGPAHGFGAIPKKEPNPGPIQPTPAPHAVETTPTRRCLDSF